MAMVDKAVEDSANKTIRCMREAVTIARKSKVLVRPKRYLMLLFTILLTFVCWLKPDTRANDRRQ